MTKMAHEPKRPIVQVQNGPWVRGKRPWDMSCPVFVGMSESRPHCTDRISRDPHTRCAVTSPRAEIWASEKVDWVGRNEQPIFRRLWTKVHQISYARRGVIAVFNAVFRSTISCSCPEIFAIKARNPKFWCFSAPKFFWGRDPPNFWLNLKNYSHHRTCGKVWWRSAQRPPRLDGEKK